MANEIPGVKVERAGTTAMHTTYSVFVDGTEVGKVTFAKYYEPVLEPSDPFVALWAGPILCVIDRPHRTMECVERDDETHRIHSFENLWIIEGELSIDLFDPQSRTTLATYRHCEVITDSTLTSGLLRFRDFYGTTVTLDPSHSLRVVRSS